MARTASTMLPLGTAAPDFRLPDPRGGTRALADFADRQILVVMFICNHCPFVIHVRDGLVEFARDYRDRDVAIVAAAREHGYAFPYLFDESQETARAYRAACTPDFFVFDAERRLAYRGQFDDSRPESGIPVTGADLRAAVDALLAGRPAPAEQKPSLGCNIKWKPGNEPDY
jgi:peroxiredoxin